MGTLGWFGKESKIKINVIIRVMVNTVSVHRCIQRMIAQTGGNAESVRNLRYR